MILCHRPRLMAFLRGCNTLLEQLTVEMPTSSLSAGDIETTSEEATGVRLLPREAHRGILYAYGV